MVRADLELELYQQTNARLWRQGQSETVTIHHIICKDTVDEDVMAALEKKDITQEKLIAAVKARYIECNGLWQVQNCGYSWFSKDHRKEGRAMDEKERLNSAIRRIGNTRNRIKKSRTRRFRIVQNWPFSWQNPTGRC